MGKLMTTAEQIARAFVGGASLTVAEIQRATGLHPARIRRYLHPPHYRRVGRAWPTRRRAVWLWVREESR